MVQGVHRTHFRREHATQTDVSGDTRPVLNMPGTCYFAFDYLVNIYRHDVESFSRRLYPEKNWLLEYHDLHRERHSDKLRQVERFFRSTVIVGMDKGIGR